PPTSTLHHVARREPGPVRDTLTLLAFSGIWGPHRNHEPFHMPVAVDVDTPWPPVAHQVGDWFDAVLDRLLAWSAGDVEVRLARRERGEGPVLAALADAAETHEGPFPGPPAALPVGSAGDSGTALPLPLPAGAVASATGSGTGNGTAAAAGVPLPGVHA